jgi:iron complex outermembrane receptor protein
MPVESGPILAGGALILEIAEENLADEHYRPSQSTRSRPREFLATLSARF